jgi:ubiquinone/menaquinone biosynthesis C-methylase UbiE
MSERLRSIAEEMEIHPDDRVLKTGCRQGAATTFVCERRERGHLAAADRSPMMVQAATRRIAEHVEAGKAEFIVENLENLDVGDWCFGKIFAVRVGLSYRDSDRPHRLLEPWLAPGAKVRAFFDPSSSEKAAR